MRESHADLFDPKTIMDSDFSPGGLASGSGSDSDFAFAFNDRNFSDRVLTIEIIADLPETKADGEGYTSIADWARNRKRRREEIKKETGSSESPSRHNPDAPSQKPQAQPQPPTDTTAPASSSVEQQLQNGLYLSSNICPSSSCH